MACAPDVVVDLRAGRERRLLEFNVPICGVQELLPRGVTAVRQADAQRRVAFRFNRRTGQFQVRLRRRSSAFSDVALDAGADDVPPARASAAGTGHDVIQRQFRRREAPTAILTHVAVPGEQVAAVKLDLLTGKLGERKHTNDAWDGQVEPHRADPVVVIRFKLALVAAQLRPIIEVIRNIATVLGVDDLCDGLEVVILFEQKRKRAANTHHAQRHVVRVQQQHLTGQSGCRYGYGGGCEDETSFR